jgi:hypothetical protein
LPCRTRRVQPERAGDPRTGIRLYFGLRLGLAVWLDRRDTGFHDQEKVLGVHRRAGLGMVPRLSDPTAATLSLDNTVTALRAVAVGAGLIGAAGLKKVAMITFALPQEGTSALPPGWRRCSCPRDSACCWSPLCLSCSWRMVHCHSRRCWPTDKNCGQHTTARRRTGDPC